MREILFKAKRKNDGEWVEGYVSRPFSENTEGNITNYCFNALDEMGFVSECIVSANTICQYTGLTDKNGNKIWENDILKMTYLHSGFAEHYTEVGMVKYINNLFRYNLVIGKESYNFDSTCEMEVIGNIFDNPELLKGE